MPVLPSFHGNETCYLKHRPRPGPSRNPVRSEIFGFITHKSTVNTVVIRGIANANN